MQYVRDRRPIDAGTGVGMPDGSSKGAEAVEAFRSGAGGQVVLVLQGGGCARGLPGRGLSGPAPGRCPTGLDHRHLDRRHQCEPDRRQPSRAAPAGGTRILGACAKQSRLGNRFPTWTGLGDAMSYWATLCGGVSGFFPTQPNRLHGSACPARTPTGPASTPRCRCARHWASLSIPALLNKGEPRLVGAAHVRTSTMHYFDSREQPINLDHILASGALPARSRPCGSTASSIGTAASCRTRRRK